MCFHYIYCSFEVNYIDCSLFTMIPLICTINLAILYIISSFSFIQRCSAPSLCKDAAIKLFRITIHPIYHGYIWCDSAHSTAITMIKRRSDLYPRTPPCTSPLRGELWGFCRELCQEKSQRYIENAYYISLDWNNFPQTISLFVPEIYKMEWPPSVMRGTHRHIVSNVYFTSDP